MFRFGAGHPQIKGDVLGCGVLSRRLSVLTVAAVVTTTIAHAAAQPRLPTDMASSMTDQPIVLLGASFAAGWQLPQVSGHPIVNKGVGGNHSFDMLARFDRDVVALRPRAVIV
jgi:hypothetical protein